MSNFKKVVNSVTNQTEVQFTCTLKSVEDQVRTLDNENSTEYRRCIIEYANKHGVVKTTPADIWESNYQKGISVGTDYLATARTVQSNTDPSRNLVFINVSSLTAELPEEDDFDFTEIETPAEAVVGE